MKKINYINNPDLYKALVEFKNKINAMKEGDPRPQIPNYVGDAILKISRRLATKPNFVNYSYREDMIADAIENCVMYIDRFNPEKSQNPFAYITQICWNAMLRRIAKEKKQELIKKKLRLQAYHEGFLIPEDPEYYKSIALDILLEDGIIAEPVKIVAEELENE